MKDFFGNPHVSRDGILIRQVHLDRDLGGGSNSFRWGAPLFLAGDTPLPYSGNGSGMSPQDCRDGFFRFSSVCFFPV